MANEPNIEQISAGWLKDYLGTKFAPKTLIHQVHNIDGSLYSTTVDKKLARKPGYLVEVSDKKVDKFALSPNGVRVEAQEGAEVFNDLRLINKPKDLAFWNEDKNVRNYGNAAIGTYSHAEGSCTTAYGDYSHAEGYQVWITGLGTHGEGLENTIEEADGAHVEGARNYVSGICAHSEGYDNSAYGNYSHTEGAGTITLGSNAHAEGLQTGALGLGSHSEGADFHLFSLTLKGGKGARNYNITNKSAVKDIEYRLIPGITKVKINNEESINVTGFSGTSVTLDSTLSAQSAFEGAVTFMTYNACGTGSHTEGVGTFVASTPEGETDEEELAGYGAHAEGARTMSLGLGSHAEGSYSIAKGVAAHAEGYNSYAEGRCSHAQGCNTIAIGEMSSASGFNTIASGSIQSVFGKYNIDDTEDQFAIIVGGGENNTERSNLYTLDWEGTGTFKNNLVVTNDLSALNITATEQLEAANLSVTDSVEIGDALTVTGDATFEGTITGAQAVLFEDSLTVSGESTLNDTLTVNSSASITDDLEVECDLDVHGGIDVSGDVYVTGDIHCENFIGNASTATEFESAETVKLTGDVTGETSSTAGWTVATTLANSGVTAGSYGPSANATPGHSGTFNVPYITVDAKGRVTSCSTKTITLPSDNNTDTLVTQNYSTSSSNYPLLFSATAGTTETTSRGAKTAILNNAIYANPYSGTITATKVKGAVWNDYAEYRNQKEYIEAGYCVTSHDDGTVSKTTKKYQACDGIVSDTYGFAIGETEESKTPLAVAGRVLAYCHGNRYDYHAGDTVCAGPEGKVMKMSREEIKEWPDRIVGIVSEIPDYEIWGSGNVKVNGRIWIKVK